MQAEAEEISRIEHPHIRKIAEKMLKNHFDLADLHRSSTLLGGLYHRTDPSDFRVIFLGDTGKISVLMPQYKRLLGFYINLGFTYPPRKNYPIEVCPVCNKLIFGSGTIFTALYILPWSNIWHCSECATSEYMGFELLTTSNIDLLLREFGCGSQRFVLFNKSFPESSLLALALRHSEDTYLGLISRALLIERCELRKLDNER